MDIHENAKLTPRSGTGIGKRVLEEEPTAAAVSANRSPTPRGGRAAAGPSSRGPSPTARPAMTCTSNLRFTVPAD